MNRALLCASLLWCCTFSALAAEKNVYVIDQITITLRSGQGTQHQILRTLPSGSPLQILGQNNDTGYTHVRTKDGVEGWVLSQYLIDEPTSKIKLTQAEQKLSRIEAENKELKARFEEIEKEKATLEQEKTTLAAEREKLEADKSTAAVAAAAVPATAVEGAAPAPLPPEKELEMLRQENQILKERQSKDWLIVGGGVMLIGIIFGMVFSRFKVRRSGWGGDTL